MTNFSVTIPINPDELIGLSQRNLAKHALDGAGSPLNALDMGDMQGKTIAANTLNISAKQLNRDKEQAFESRDIALGIDVSQEAGIPGTVDFYLKSSRDVLLGINKGKEQKLGEHGFEVDKSDGNTSVFIPTQAPEMIALAKLILAKHTLDGAGSVLNVLSMADFSAKYILADAQHTLATKLNRDKETAVRDRDTILGIAVGQKITTAGTVRFYVASVRDVLLGVKKGSEQHLGDWGFDVQFNTTIGEFSSISLTIDANSTKSALKNFTFEPTMQFELRNTGVTPLKVGIAPAENTIPPGGVLVAAATEQTVAASGLGNTNETFMNVTNADVTNEGKMTVKKVE